MSKTSCSAIDELYAYKLAHNKITKEAIPKFRQKVAVKRAAEITKELESSEQKV